MALDTPTVRPKHDRSLKLDTGGRQLIPLRTALRIVGASERTYYRHLDILPPPVRRSGRLYFFLDEIYALLEKLRAERDAQLAPDDARSQ